MMRYKHAWTNLREAAEPPGAARCLPDGIGVCEPLLFTEGDAAEDENGKAASSVRSICAELQKLATRTQHGPDKALPSMLPHAAHRPVPKVIITLPTRRLYI
jgi:hypothetical protein